MKLSYYVETDSLYIELRDVPGVETREVSDGLRIDLADDGLPVGLDIDGASRLDLRTLEQVALPAQVTPTLDPKLDFASENAALRRRISELEAQLAFLGNHRTFAAGIAGETLVSELIQGELTTYAAGFDVSTSTGLRLEVKRARLTEPAKGYPSRRWQWAKVFGESGSKTYDYLLLVGEADSRFASYYRDSSAPFVFFVIPAGEVEALTTQGTRSGRSILLSTDPRTVRAPASRRLYQEYQVTSEELRVQFGLSATERISPHP